MLRFLAIFILFSLTLKAQVKTISLKIIFQKDVNPTKLIMVFDDGLNEKVVKFSELDAEKGVTINTECHAEYLKIAVIGLYKEDKFGNYEVFYANNPSATIEFSKKPNLNDNQIYHTKLINVEERKNLGESKYNDFISEEVTKSLLPKTN